MIVDKEKIKAIIFDWGGVCCAEGEPFASLDLQYTLKMNPNEIADKAREIYNDYYIGKYNRDTFWRSILQHFGLSENTKLNPGNLSQAYLSSYNVYQDVLDLILKLRRKYQIGLLSNLTPEMRDHVQTQHHLEKYFDTQIYSCDSHVATMKPERKIYEIILEKMNFKAENCLFIDNSEKNINTAKDLGFLTILFKNKEQFINELDLLL